MTELVSRGKVLEDAVRSGLTIFESQVQPKFGAIQRFSIVEDPLPSLAAGSEEVHPNLAVHNSIWLQAALTYLYVVISGWQPSNPEIQCSVAQTEALLASLPGNTCLRSLVWPFCISGCLSLPGNEDNYRAMAHRMGALEVFGTVKEALTIMEKVWSRRDQTHESWDVAKCMRILGHGVLLI